MHFVEFFSFNKIGENHKEKELAVEIDRFTHDCDEILYHDSTRNMTENVSELHDLIQQGDTEHLSIWLNEVISEGVVPDKVEWAKELLEKLAEYKLLAKIKEMEEQNYNMIDNVLNNGAEKAQREANKKEREQPSVKVSLKARLAEKKVQVAGHGREHEAQENIKIVRGRCKRMKHNFTAEEVNLICIFASESEAFTLESRSKVIADIERTLPYLDDTDMAELSNRIIEKLRNMTDEEFGWLELIGAE